MALMLLDLSLEFDTVEHSTELSVMERRFWVVRRALRRLSSYLTDRTQVFIVDDTQSEVVPVGCSALHGSVLACQEIIAYNEDIQEVFRRYGINHYLFADDKQAYIYFSASAVVC
jgi:hypothetical protein